ncbi:MAG: 7-cyano-7-deazaguanine synthase QueC [Candidatus Omnitrophica bacterium]|jgi:7-cyano-7-deazaguanine synthase|nr:7-cyano-7-deazaguanine synthase QueC [Candidatus Omnitrophota bacterium]MDD5079704.1 7-cyano-7-deazaguanine synthase QueC [Candidatus Omnitrophota bacterium]
MRNKKRAIVLLSGGLDSAVTLYFSRAAGFVPYCLIFDYGQRHKREIEASKKICRKSGCEFQVAKISLPWKGSALLDKKRTLPRATGDGGVRSIPATYVPGRNIIFLSFALSFAEAVAARAIFIGAHSQDYSGYPDCRPEFFRAFDKVALTGTKAGAKGSRITIHRPLLRMNKAQIIRLGNKLGVPFELTWSCYTGGGQPCGKCDSCYFRARGFLQAGLADPALR